MLFYHTQLVIQKQAQQEELHQIIDIQDDEGEGEDEDAEKSHWAVEENYQIYLSKSHHCGKADKCH